MQIAQWQSTVFVLLSAIQCDFHQHSTHHTHKLTANAQFFLSEQNEQTTATVTTKDKLTGQPQRDKETDLASTRLGQVSEIYGDTLRKLSQRMSELSMSKLTDSTLRPHGHLQVTEKITEDSRRTPGHMYSHRRRLAITRSPTKSPTPYPTSATKYPTFPTKFPTPYSTTKFPTKYPTTKPTEKPTTTRLTTKAPTIAAASNSTVMTVVGAIGGAFFVAFVCLVFYRNQQKQAAARVAAMTTAEEIGDQKYWLY